MAAPGTAVILAPFWGQAGHVGVYRVERFVRWLSEAGVGVVLVRAGDQDGTRPQPWGEEVTIRDPKRAYVKKSGGSPGGRSRSGLLDPLRHLQNFIRPILSAPDRGVVWARRAAGHPLVLERAAGARFVLSSHPPESAHVGASALAGRMGVPHVVDMRDGWLDEPLKPALVYFPPQRWREAKMERGVLTRAAHILVTSVRWKEMLVWRLPEVSGKVTVLTNACPRSQEGTFDASPRSGEGPLTLLYSGRLAKSNMRRKVSDVLEPLMDCPAFGAGEGRVVFQGDFLATETARMVRAGEQMAQRGGWSVQVMPMVSREEAMRTTAGADGLLLLSASEASLPAKLFEYLMAKRPILAFTPEGSAVWRVAEGIPQLFAADYRKGPASANTVAAFLAACRERTAGDPPPEFTEAHLSRVFLSAVEVA